MRPPVCNTGGNRPNTPPKTIIDWFSFTYLETSDFAQNSRLREQVLNLVPNSNLSDTLPGVFGYPSQRQILVGSAVCGWIAYGADHNRAWVVITGQGLTQRRYAKRSDTQLIEFMDSWPGMRLGRIDIALDVTDGSVTPEGAKKAWKQGQFSLPPAMKAPRTRMIESNTYDDDKNAQTFYVGSRKASKKARIYMKGFQLMGTYTPDEFWEGVKNGIFTCSLPENLEDIEKWTRVEIQYEHDKLKPLSWDMIRERDSYFAGSYPWAASVLKDAGAAKLDNIPKEQEVEVMHLVRACRDSYGGLIYHLRHVLGWTDDKIIKEIIGTKSAARIKSDKEGVANPENPF